jgi:hypothetical protein
MTHDEALQEAKRRWGEKGFIRGDSGRYRVGKNSGGIFWVEGAGNSWQEAFRIADQKKKNPRARKDN